MTIELDPSPIRPETIPAPTKKPRRAPAHKKAIVLGIIGVFWAISPLSFVYLAWSACAYSTHLSHYAPADTLFHAVLRYYFAIEAAFAVVYRLLALYISRRRPPTDYDHQFLRNAVKNVLESNMGSAPTSPVGSPVASALSSRRSSATEPRFRRQARNGSIDSGYASTASCSSDDEKAEPALPTVSEDGAPATSYNFLSPKLTPDDPRAVDFREASRHWFHGAPFSSVYKEDAKQWMSWSLYGQPLKEIVRERRKSVSEGVRIEALPKRDDIGRDKLETVEYSTDLWESRTGVKLREGKNPSVNVITLTLDPVRVLSRPLLLYGIIWLAQQCYSRKLTARGFTYETHGGLDYFVRVPRGWKSDPENESTRPFLFLHGLGIGPAQYAPFLNKLCKEPAFKDRPIAILVQPHLSMSLFNKAYLSPPNARTCSSSIRAMSLARGFDGSGLTVLSHSNGTIVHGWLLKAYPGLVKRSCLVDPVCFALWEPSLPYNFLYATARSPMQLLMRFFVARELGVANTLQRRFDWISSLLRPCEIPNAGDEGKAAVYLSERDAIVDTPRIANYLAGEGLGEGAGLRIFAKQKHGDAMLGIGKPFEQVMRWCRDEA